MCDCFHLAFPNWHAASSGTGAGRRLRGPEPETEGDSIGDEPSQFTEGERPRPQGSSPVEEYPETEKYTDSDKECEVEHDPHHESGSGKKTKKSGLGSIFEKRSTPKMSKLKEVHSPESAVIVKTAKDGCAEGLVYGGGGREGIFIKEVVPESPASKSLKLKEGDQILSATVYFDNMSYEDAIQILEHAQAYKVKLCLKRKPDITETEPAIKSDVIPEEELCTPEMREQGKTKRRGDSRISWPKFPSFGKGQKSRFTRSHSSSEADEQRKLELSPTTSDTESPIKSQDALKGKKRHKIKLSALTKRGRTSSSEDQETPTTGQISDKTVKTYDTSDMLSPECLESPSGETPEVYVTEDLKVVEDQRLEQNDEKLTEVQTVRHKVELITVDSTLKTADLTVALADKESSSFIKSPDGKKKKKERSELKMKILGKDKLHKKDTKAKSSPKRLKTLGASIEIPDQPENEKSEIIPSFASHTKLEGDQLTPNTKQVEMSIPKVELDISDMAFICKSPQKGEEKIKKGKDIKQKQETKTDSTFKLPKIGLSDIKTEEIIQERNVNVEECTTKIEQLTTEGTEMKVDPYEQLSKSSLSRTQLPKREEIEIPGMEDMSMKTKAKGLKEPKTGFMGPYEELQAETVQLSIDVESVKEAVSKLPGYKLPKVDPSGAPIPEEITVIDANAQRISVKTPTKVVDSKTKNETHFTNFDITASTEISKTTVKLPKITPVDLTSEALLTETKVDLKKTEKKYITKEKQSNTEVKTEVYKREDIIIPGRESVHTQKKQSTEGIKSKYESTATLSPKESDKKSKQAKKTMAGFGIAKPNIKVPDIGIDFPKQNISQQKGDTVRGEGTIFLQEVKTSKTETRKVKRQIGGDISGVKIPEIEGIEYIDSIGDSPAKKDGGVSLTGFGVNTDAAKTDIFIPEIRGEVKDVDAEECTIKLPKFGAVTADISVNVPDADKDINIDCAEIKAFERDGKGSKFRMPNLDISMPKVKGSKIDLSLSKKDVDTTLPEAKAEFKLPDVPEVDITHENIDVSILQETMEVKKPEMEIQPLQIGDGEHGSNLAITMPKVKSPKVDLSFSKNYGDSPEAKAIIKIPEEANISVDNKHLQSEAEMDVQGSKFKMPKLGITIPKVKGPAIDFSLSKKDIDLTQPEPKAEVKVPDVELKEPSAKVEIKAPEITGAEKDAEGPPSKFKMPAFKLPKFGGTSPTIIDEESNKTKAIQIPKTKLKPPKEGVVVDIKTPNTDIEGQSIDVTTTAAELDEKGSKFKMPKFEISLPKVTGPEIDLSLSRKVVDVTLPEPKARVESTEPGVKVEVKAPEIAVCQQDVEGSPTKFKMPTFKLPKFGVGAPNTSVKVHDMDKNVKIDGDDINIPEEGFAVNIAAPSVDIESPLIDMKTTETEQDERGSKFKMPHLGFSMPKVKGPKIDLSLSKKDIDVTLAEPNADVTLPDVDLGKADVLVPEAKMEIPEAKAEVKLPEAPKIALEMDLPQFEAEMDGHGGKFKAPKFGFKMPKMKGPKFDRSLSKKDVDVKLSETKVDAKLPEAALGKVDVSIPEAKMEVKNADLEMQSLQIEGELDEQGERFKMPKFGMKMQTVKGPEFDLSLSKNDKGVTSQQTKFEVKLPDAPEMDVSLGKAEVLIPEAKAEGKKPELGIKLLQTETEGQGSKFKMPKFGMAMPRVKGPEFHFGFSKTDVDVTAPEVKADVNLPDVELKEPLASAGAKPALIPETKVEVKRPEEKIKPLQTDVKLERQEGKFKMPKFGITMPKVKGPEINLSFSKRDVDVTLPEAKAEVEPPEAPTVSMEMKPPEREAEIGGHGSKFEVPKFGVSLPKVQGPEINVSVLKKDVHVKIPEAKAEVKFPATPEIDTNLEKVNASIPDVEMEVKKPELEIKPLQSEGEIDGQGRNFKMPKFGLSMQKEKGPDIDFSLSKKDVDITLPEAKADVNLPDAELKESSAKAEIKAPKTEAQLHSVKGSPSKFKMPTFKFPKFAVATSNDSTEVPDIDKGVKTDGADLHISVPHTDVDGPEVKAEVQLPDIEVKELSGGDAVVDQQPGVEVEVKMKKPRFSLPKFSFSKPSVKAPDSDVGLLDVNVAIPEEKVEEKVGQVDMKPTEYEAEVDGQGRKFKMPKLGITMPKVKGPEIDLSLSKKDVDVALPEAKAEGELPYMELKEPFYAVEINAPEIKDVMKDTEGSPSKLKTPLMKSNLPKFGVGTPSATIELPDMDKDVKIDGADIKIPEEVLTVDIAAPSIDTEGPSIDMKTTGTELEGKGSKFKMPSLGFSVPQVKRPDIDLSLSKKDVDVDVTSPEAKAKVELPDVKLQESSAKVEIKAPGIDDQTSSVQRSPSKFKMPTFKLPKFGIAAPQVIAEVPDADKDIEVDGADLKLPQTKVEVKLPDVEIREPVGSISVSQEPIPEGDAKLKKTRFSLPKFSFSKQSTKEPGVDISLPDTDISLPEGNLEVKQPEVELKLSEGEVEFDGQGSKFKIPKFGVSTPKVKVPKMDVSLSKKDVDVTLPEVPDIETQAGHVEGSPSKLKMPTFTLPKFGAATPQVSVEVPDVDIKIHAAKLEVPEEGATVDITAPSIDIEGPSPDVKAKGSEFEESGSKFKMPNFGISVPKVRRPEIDLSLSKKDVDVTLPEAKAEFILPDVELKEPSAEVEIKAPAIKVGTKNTEGSPSKFKLPSFNLPKFGASTPSATIELPGMDKDVKIDGADIKIPEEVLKVDIAAPSVDTEGPSIDMKTTGTEHEGKGSKFKMPSLGFSVPQVKRPDIDLNLSKKEEDLTLTEVEAKVQLPDAEIQESAAKVEIKAPVIDVQTSTDKGSPSKFKMPTFKLPKFGIAAPQVSVEVPDVDKDIEVDGADLKLPQTKVEVKLPDVEIREPVGSISVSQEPIPDGDAKLKKTRFSLPKFSFSKQSTKEPGGDLHLPEADISLPEGNLEVKPVELEFKPSGGDTELDGQGSKFKIPKFGVSMPKVKGPKMDMSLSKKDVDVTLPEAKAEVQLPDVKIKETSAKVQITAPEIEAQAGNIKGSPSKLKMPTFTFPKFGAATPQVSAEVPDVDKDIKIDGAKLEILKEGAAVHVTAPSIDTEGLSLDVKAKGSEFEGSGSKFKMPNFGISMPKVKGPEIDISLSKKDVDVTLPEAKAEVRLPDVELKEPSAEVEIKAPVIKIGTKNTEGSPSKFKLPSFNLPKFGVGTPSVTVEVPNTDKDVKIDGADIKIPEEVLTVDIAAPSVDTEGPSIDMKTTGTEHEGKGSKFKMPSLGFSVPQVKRPDIDLNLSKKEEDLTLTEVEAKVQLPDAEIQESAAKVEIKAPVVDIQTSADKGSPSKFKMPTFKLPKFGIAAPQVSVEVPDVDKDIEVDGADLKLPQTKVEVELPDIEINKPVGSISVSQAPMSEDDAKLKKTRFSLPKFSFSKQSTKEHGVDVSLPDTDISLRKGNEGVKQPEVEFKPSEVDTEFDGQGSKFKIPKFGVSMPKVKGPKIDMSLSKKDVDVTLPEAKAEVQLPDVKIKETSAKVDVTTPETEAQAGNIKGSPSKLKMPTFTFPKFGAATPQVSVEVPDVDKGIKIDGTKLEIPKEGATVKVTAPSIDTEGLSQDVKAKGSELEQSGSKFKMPKFGISMPTVKGPEIDLSLPKKDVDVALREDKAEVQLPDVKIKQPSAKVQITAPEIEAEAVNVEGSPSKLKMPTFTFPKFGASTPKVSVEAPDVDKDISIDGAKQDVPKEGAKVDVKASSIQTERLYSDVKAKGSKLDESGSKFKMPKFSISMPKVKGPEIDMSLSKKDVDVTLPEDKAEVQLPDVKIKQPSAKVEVIAPEIEAQTVNIEGSPSKLKMPTFTFPKFGASTPKVNVEVPDVDKDININGAKLKVPKQGAKVDVTLPCIDTEGLSVDVKDKRSGLEGSGSKFKLPNIGIQIPKVEEPEIDLSLSKKEVDVTLPESKVEVKLPSVKVEEPEDAVSVPDAPTVEAEPKLKRRNWTLPKFSFSRTGDKGPDVDINVETPKVNVTSPEVKAEVCLPDAEVHGPLGTISKEPPAAELDANLKKTKFSLPRFSLLKSSVKEPEVSAELPHVDVSLPEGNVDVKQPEIELKAPELEAEHDGQGSKFKLPKFGIALPKPTGPEEAVNASQREVGITLPEVKADVTLPETSVNEESKASETEAKLKDVKGSPLKFKMPTMKMPKLAGATYDVTVEATDAEKVAETDGAKLKEDVTVNITGQSVDIQTDASKAAITDTDMPKTETHGSPSKFKLPSFKMPKLSFTRPKPEDEYVPVESECKDDQLEMEVEPKGETKSPKMTLTSFGEILKNIDVEFDVSNTDKEEENFETSKKVDETDEPRGKQLDLKKKETKPDTTKSPERTGWFKFPKFGLSSPSEPVKISDKEEHKDEKSPVGETVEEEISPTCSVQSSDAFADISSAMTSEHVGASSSSPTKVTVKYSDSTTDTGLAEMHSNIITSTTRTELISVVPNLPEKITILSSGVSSSSEDTLRLESGKIHVITSNIQATPESQHAKLLTAVQIQSAEGFPLKSEADKAALWTVEDSQSGKRKVFERHLIRETSSERSESKETIVITKQITHMFDSSEPISGETASSIQRLRDSVHSEKMRFFDGAEK